jgi:hypothetical protein
MTVWDWFNDSHREALARGDVERMRLRELLDEAYGLRERDPDAALALFKEGERRAEALGESWWSLLYRWLRVHALLHFKCDCSNVLAPAVQNVLDLRRPEFTGFPLRYWILRDLVTAYVGIDAEGYAEQVREALAQLEAEVGEDVENRLSLLGLWRHFALECDDLDAAHAYALRSLAVAEESGEPGLAAHDLVFCYSGLSEIAYRRAHWDRLAEWAHLGEELARQVGHQLQLAEFLMWQAVLAQRGGAAPVASRLQRAAASRLRGLAAPPGSYYFDALCAYRELRGDLVASLRARELELQSLEGTGQLDSECRVRVKLCRALARLGRPLGEEWRKARAAARRLRKPGKYLEELERLAGGGS